MVASMAVLALNGFTAYAQMPGADGPPGMTAALTKMFGDIKAFTAKAEIQVLNSAQEELASMPMNFALLDKKVRVDIDMTQTKSANMPPGATAVLQQMGMAQVVSIIRPDKKTAYVFYPNAKVMMTLPVPEETSASLSKTELGKETVDGHPCVKNRVAVKDENGKEIEVITWNATDLKNFPIQIKTQEKENTSFVRFKGVQFNQPETGQFEPPAGYTQYNSPEDLMRGVLAKTTSGAGTKSEKK